jgi:hypothetical protein
MSKKKRIAIPEGVVFTPGSIPSKEVRNTESRDRVAGSPSVRKESMQSKYHAVPGILDH